MEATPENRGELRLLIDEVIPSGGTDADTRFTDAELDRILQGATDLYAAAAEAWERKADRAMSERGGLEESSGGSERLRFVRLQEYRDHCRETAARFRAKAGLNGSRVLAMWPPDVLGTADADRDGYVDLEG